MSVVAIFLVVAIDFLTEYIVIISIENLVHYTRKFIDHGTLSDLKHQRQQTIDTFENIDSRFCYKNYL